MPKHSSSEVMTVTTAMLSSSGMAPSKGVDRFKNERSPSQAQRVVKYT